MQDYSQGKTAVRFIIHARNQGLTVIMQLIQLCGTTGITYTAKLTLVPNQAIEKSRQAETGRGCCPVKPTDIERAGTRAPTTRPLGVAESLSSFVKPLSRDTDDWPNTKLLKAATSIGQEVGDRLSVLSASKLFGAVLCRHGNISQGVDPHNRRQQPCALLKWTEIEKTCSTHNRTRHCIQVYYPRHNAQGNNRNWTSKQRVDM